VIKIQKLAFSVSLGHGYPQPFVKNNVRHVNNALPNVTFRDEIFLISDTSLSTNGFCALLYLTFYAGYTSLRYVLSLCLNKI